MIKTTIQEKVLNFLIKRKVAVTQQKDALNLKPASVSNACKALKKKKLAGFDVSWKRYFPGRIYKVYWSYTMKGGENMTEEEKKPEKEEGTEEKPLEEEEKGE